MYVYFVAKRNCCSFLFLSSLFQLISSSTIKLQTVIYDEAKMNELPNFSFQYLCTRRSRFSPGEPFSESISRIFGRYFSNLQRPDIFSFVKMLPQTRNRESVLPRTRNSESFTQDRLNSGCARGVNFCNGGMYN